MTIEESWEALNEALKEDQRIKGYAITLKLLTPEEEFFVISLKNLKRSVKEMNNMFIRNSLKLNYEDEIVALMEDEYDRGRLWHINHKLNT